MSWPATANQLYVLICSVPLNAMTTNLGPDQSRQRRDRCVSGHNLEVAGGISEGVEEQVEEPRLGGLDNT